MSKLFMRRIDTVQFQKKLYDFKQPIGLFVLVLAFSAPAARPEIHQDLVSF